MKKSSRTKMTVLEALMLKVPGVRTVLGYIETLRNNTISLYMLANRVHEHQQILERFVSVSQALSASLANSPDCTTDDKGMEKPN